MPCPCLLHPGWPCSGVFTRGRPPVLTGPAGLTSDASPHTGLGRGRGDRAVSGKETMGADNGHLSCGRPFTPQAVQLAAACPVSKSCQSLQASRAQSCLRKPHIRRETGRKCSWNLPEGRIRTTSKNVLPRMQPCWLVSMRDLDNRSWPGWPPSANPATTRGTYGLALQPQT